MRISGSVWQQQLNTEHSKTGQMELHFQKLNSGNGVPSENCSDHICRDGNIKAQDISSSLMFNSQCLLRPNRTLSGIITVTEQQCFYSIFHAYALNKEYPCEWCAVCKRHPFAAAHSGLKHVHLHRSILSLSVTHWSLWPHVCTKVRALCKPFTFTPQQHCLQWLTQLAQLR